MINIEKDTSEFQTALTIAEAWAANSQGDPKLITKLLTAAGVHKPSSPLLKKESLTISSQPKTAALCFDRVWASRGDIPDSVRFWGGSPLETFTAASIISLPSTRKQGLGECFISKESLKAFGNEIKPDRAEAKSSSESSNITLEELARLTEKFMTNLIILQLSRFDKHLHGHTANTVPSELYKLEDVFINQSITKFQQAAVLTACKRLPAPIYQKESSLRSEYQEGDTDLLFAVIRDVALVDEETLEWEQVLEFRQDTRAKERYRRFVHWLDSDCIGKSEEYILNAVRLKLSDYEAALRKHGVVTLRGVLATVLDKNNLIASAAGAFAAHQMTPNSLWTAAGAVVPIIGHTLLEISKAVIGRDDISRGANAEIAFLHELRQRQGDKRSKATRPN